MAIKDEETRQRVTEMRRAFYRQPGDFRKRLAEVHQYLNPGNKGAAAGFSGSENHTRDLNSQQGD